MRHELLLIARDLEPYLAPLEAHCNIHRLYEADDPDALLDTLGKHIQIVGTNGHIGCSTELMDSLPNLAMIGSFGVGYDGIDTDAARQRGIRASNTPEVLNDAVAELALGLVLALARRIPQSDQFVRAGAWLKSPYPLTQELSGRSVGILGLGRIGKEVARRLQAMKMRVVYHGRNRQPHEPYEYFDNLETMAEAVDWLVITVPGGPGADGMVNTEVLKALGPEGCLVNVSRGSVVDEAALCTAISTGTLGGAALDVFDREPRVPDELLRAENVVLSPHAGSATHKTRSAMGQLVIRNIQAFLDDRPLLSPIA